MQERVLGDEILFQDVYLNPTSLKQQEAVLLYNLLLQVEPDKDCLVTKDKVQLDNTIYCLDLEYAISIKRNDKNEIIYLEIYKEINPSGFYQEELQNYELIDNFYFLCIREYYGRLVFSQEIFSFQAYVPLKFYFSCPEIDIPTASLPQRIFLNDIFQLKWMLQKIYLDINHRISVIESGHLKKGTHIFKFQTLTHFVEIKFSLKSSIALRESLWYPGQYRADVLDKSSHQVEQARYAKAFSVLGTFKNLNFCGKSKVLKDYVVSYLNNNGSSILPDVLLERIEITKKIPSLSPSHITGALAGNIHWQISEKNLPGITLRDFIRQNKISDRENNVAKNEITINKFLKLLNEACFTLLQQYHFNNIVHGGLSPDNILVDTQDNMRCYIFDTSFSKKIDENNSDAFEQKNGENPRFSSDVYNLMAIMANLLNPNFNFFQRKLSLHAGNGELHVLDRLCSKRVLSEQHTLLLKTCFYSALQLEPEKRFSLEIIFKTINSIIWSRSQKKVKFHQGKLVKDFKNAHQQGLDIRSKFMPFNKKLHEKTNQEIYVSKTLASVSDRELLNFKEHFIDCIHQQKNDYSVLAEFCKMSGIYAIQKLKQHEVIKETVCNMIDSYLDKVAKLNLMLAEACDNREKSIIESLLILREKYLFTFENIELLNKKFDHYIKYKTSQSKYNKNPEIALLKNISLFVSNRVLCPPIMPYSAPDFKRGQV